MRRLSAPTLTQWGCAHVWKEQSTKVWGDKLHRTRYYFCRRCGLRVKTQETPQVPWTEQDLVAVVRAMFPEGERVYLRDRGLETLPLHALNTLLQPQGLMIHTAKVRDTKRFVACTDIEGRIELYGLFELRPIEQDIPRRTHEKQRRGR